MAYIINISTNAATTLNLQQGRVKLEPLDYCEIHAADLEFAREHYNNKDLNLYIAETDKELELIISSKKNDSSSEETEEAKEERHNTDGRIEIPVVQTVDDMIDLDQVSSEEILNSEDIPENVKEMIRVRFAQDAAGEDEMIEFAEVVDEMEEPGSETTETTETEEKVEETVEESTEEISEASTEEGSENEESTEETTETSTEESTEETTEDSSDSKEESIEKSLSRQKLVEEIELHVREGNIEALRAMAKDLDINIGPNIGAEKLASKICNVLETR